MVATEAVVLAGGADPRLSPLTDPEHPKCLLPVANWPAILYALTALRSADIMSVFVVVCGDGPSAKVQKYISKEPQLSSMHAKVVTVDAETGSADAVRAVADKLTSDTVVVISGDTVTDTSLSAVLFTHSIRNAGITTALARTSTSASANTKLGKTPKGVDYVAIDEKRQRLLMCRGSSQVVTKLRQCWLYRDFLSRLTYAYSPTQLHKDMVPLAAVKACSGMVLTTEMRDACIYMLSRPVIDKIVQANVQVDVLPLVVNEQWSVDVAPSRDGSLRTSASLPDHAQVSICEETARYFAEQSPLRNAVAAGSQVKLSDSGIGSGSAFCAVHVIDSGTFCRRINTMQTYLDANRDLAATAGSGGLLAAQSPVHASAEVGNKATVASGSLVGEGSGVQDRASVKRSVIGRRCQVGVNARILNSVLMDGCMVGDGAHIQNAIVGEDVRVGSKAQLKECQVGHSFTVAEGADHRDEALAKR